MTRRRAYQLLDASRILENVSTLVDTDPTSGEAVKKVLLAANKVIAHLNEEFVNEIPEPSVIVKAINQTEEWIKTRIFEPNGISYDETVATERGDMRRQQTIMPAGQPAGQTVGRRSAA